MVNIFQASLQFLYYLNLITLVSVGVIGSKISLTLAQTTNTINNNDSLISQENDYSGSILYEMLPSPPDHLSHKRGGKIRKKIFKHNQFFLGQNLPKNSGNNQENSIKEATFLVGLNKGKINMNPSVLVKGKMTDKEAIDFDNWLVPYGEVLAALNFTSQVISENEVELRSPFKVIRINVNQLRNDPELGLVMSIKQIKELFGINVEFSRREYAIIFNVPEVKNTPNKKEEKKPVILTGLPKVGDPPVLTLSVIEKRVNLSGRGNNSITNQGTLSGVGKLFDSSWFVRINQNDLTDSNTWKLSDFQILKQTDYSDYYLGTQPTFWSSQSQGDFLGFTTIQRQGFSPFPEYGGGGANIRQRLQPEQTSATITGNAEPGTLVRLVRNIYSDDIIAEKLVDGSGTYRFDNIPVGRKVGNNYQVLLYPKGVLTAQPRVEDARFNLIPEQLSVGSSALIIASGWKRKFTPNNFLGDFTEFNGGISQRWGVTKDLTMGLGSVYDNSSLYGLTDIFFNPQGSPLKVILSSLLGDNSKVNTSVIWDGYPLLSATLTNDLTSTRYNLDWQLSSQLRFYSNGDLDREKNFSLGYINSERDFYTSARLNIDTNEKLSWTLDQRLGDIYFTHRGNYNSTYSDISYQLNHYNFFILNYQTTNFLNKNNSFTAYWSYTSPSYNRYGENLWRSELGYRINSLGEGLYATVSTTIIPGLSLQARYEGVGNFSDQSSFSIQLISGVDFQGGLFSSDRQIERLRTEGGLLIQPFFDLNSNGKKDDNEEFYMDNTEFLIINNEQIKPWQIDQRRDRIIVRLNPGYYRIDLEPAGFPPDFQPIVKSLAVTVKEGGFTSVLIPLFPTYTVAGTVIDYGGKPVAGSRVEAFNPENKTSAISITNSAGVYYLEQLRLGTYQLKVNGQIIQPNTITIKADDQTLKELNLKLP